MPVDYAADNVVILFQPAQLTLPALHAIASSFAPRQRSTDLSGQLHLLRRESTTVWHLQLLQLQMRALKSRVVTVGCIFLIRRRRA